MRKTGEAYTAACARLVGTFTAPRKTGGQGMYPFERFTERAKKVLTLAQEEAERSHHSYIGTEHLLLGLLRERDGLAAKALHSLGVDIGSVRNTIESVLGRKERLIVQQIVPTSRVKKVIEASFEEARTMGDSYVGTEHLLLGLLIEGEGIAAHVLEDLGATLPKVRSEILRLLAEGHEHETGAPSPGFKSIPSLGQEALAVIELATMVAAAQGTKSVSADHLRFVLTNGGANKLLEQLAVVTRVRSAKDQAIATADVQRSLELQAEEERLLAKHRSAKAAWLKSLGRRRKPKPPDVS
jgi:hypothetical protein